MDKGLWEMSTAEETAVEGARAGSLSAFNELVLRYQARVYNLAYHLLGDPDAAADATQDSFLKAYQRLPQFRGGSFRAWLFRIATNTSYDELRKRRRRADTISWESQREDGEPRHAMRDHGESPEHSALRREQAGRIRGAIDRLPADQRTVLVLSDIEGLHYQEIAQVLGTPIGTVKSRLARARDNLRGQLHAERRILARAGARQLT